MLGEHKKDTSPSIRGIQTKVSKKKKIRRIKKIQPRLRPLPLQSISLLLISNRPSQPTGLVAVAVAVVAVVPVGGIGDIPEVAGSVLGGAEVVGKSFGVIPRNSVYCSDSAVVVRVVVEGVCR